MKKILFIAPHCFPIHSSESIVNAKLVYALAKKGYYIDVYSVMPQGYYPSSKIVDSFLSGDPKINVITIEKLHYISRRKGLWYFITSVLYNLMVLLKEGIFYNGIDTPYKIYKKVQEQIKLNGNKNPYDLVMTRTYDAELVGIKMAKKYGIKWIANWNDPYPIEKFPHPYGLGSDCELPYFKNKILKLIQKFVSVHTFPSERLRGYMLQYYDQVDIKNTVVIPHMAHTAFIPKNVIKRKKLCFVHAGNVSAPRSPLNLLKAVESLVSKGCVSDVFEILFMGKASNDLEENIKNMSLENFVKIIPSKDYFNALEFISTCTISIVIEAECDEGIYLPTKVVDSIQCQVPVFCISPKEGTQRDLINRYNIGYFADNSSVEDIEKILNTIIVDFENNNLPNIKSDNVSYFFEDEVVNRYMSII